MEERGRLAAIDCGTNSTRLLVVDRRGTVLERGMRITRLGQGVDASGALAPEAVERCLQVLRDFRAVMDGLDVREGRLVATSALRDASNGTDFLVPAQEITGLVPEVLAGDSEGRLSLAGATADVDAAEGPFVMVDIGGGSTELVVGRDGSDPDLVAVSLQMGCVRLSERFLHGDPPADEELDAARAEIGRQLEGALLEHPELTRGRRLLGLAGTVSTLAALQGGVREYERARIHHVVLTLEQVRRWRTTLAAEVAEARLDRAGMTPGREDVIVAGVLVLEAVMERLGFEELLVSESDILEGLVASQLLSR